MNRAVASVYWNIVKVGVHIEGHVPEEPGVVLEGLGDFWRVHPIHLRVFGRIVRQVSIGLIEFVLFRLSFCNLENALQKMFFER